MKKLTTIPIDFLILLLIICLLSIVSCINQKCQADTNTTLNNNNTCPSNSKCPSNGYCVCDQGYFGNCQTKGQFINSDSKQFTLTENFSYFIIQPSLSQYVYYQFTFCNLDGIDNDELLNLWSDDGNLITPDSNNALGVDKVLLARIGCTSLMTPFFAFNNQPNGQKEILLFGVRLRKTGTLKISLLVQQVQILGFDILFKIILILISGIASISIGGLIYCIYKCRRRRMVLVQQRHDISFFNDYMPAKKANLTQVKQEICSVCLGQYKQSQQIRTTVCGHYFHKTCLDEWCVTNLSCPICRASFQKANLIHHSYLINSRSSRQNDQYLNESIEQSIIEDDNVIENQNNLRKPII